MRESFFPTVMSADIDYKNYCNQLETLKNYAKELPVNESAQVIRQKLSELPNISPADFKYYTWEISSSMLFILLPLGVVAWLSSYLKLSALQDKLRQTEQTTGTVVFMLKALTN